MTTAIDTRSVRASGVLQEASVTGLVHRRGIVQSIIDGGLLQVEDGLGTTCHCEVLQAGAPLALEPGDQVLFLVPADSVGLGIVLGRVGRYAKPQPPSVLTLEAAEALSLKCGEASIDLRADGKVMVRGEDVLLRAKGTQRIRAGTVSIN